MSDVKDHTILSRLDSPVKILFWTKGEILMVVGPFFVSVIADTFLLGITACLINVYLIKVYKKYFGEGQLSAVMYWYFPPNARFQGLPRSCVREYFG